MVYIFKWMQINFRTKVTLLLLQHNLYQVATYCKWKRLGVAQGITTESVDYYAKILFAFPFLQRIYLLQSKAGEKSQ